MFEQSLLIDHTGARKTATFAASFTAQILIAGVLIAAPLFYHEVLPALRMPAAVPVLARWRPPEAPVVESHPTARSSGLAAPGVFRPPAVAPSNFRQADLIADLIIVDSDTPIISVPPGVVVLPTGAPTLPRFVPPTAAPVKPDVVKPPESPTLVGGDVQAAKLIKRVVPAYPRAAIQTRVSGTVHLLGVIAKDGTIQKLQVLSGHPLLRQAALDAVRQWVYRPTILNGQPVEVEAPIDVIFTLSQ
jgi:protein TonB